MIEIVTDEKVLRTPSTNASPEEVSQIEELLLQAMSENECVGLSAIQIGIPKNIFIVFPPWWKNHRTFTNINLHTFGKIINFEEGCLSFPNLSILCERYSACRIEQTGEVFGCETPLISEIGYQKMVESIIMQHEACHTQGLLFTDYRVDMSRKGW